MKRLAQSQIGTGAGTLLYTTPKEYKCDLYDICIANTTAAPLNVTLHIVPSGGSPSASTQLFPAVEVPANTLVHWTGRQTLSSEDFIQGIGSGSGVTITITGEEYR